MDICTVQKCEAWHSLPRSVGIYIGLANKYYTLAGDEMAANHYSKLKINAASCIKCGHCDERCPFRVAQSSRMDIITNYFSK